MTEDGLAFSKAVVCPQKRRRGTSPEVSPMCSARHTLLCILLLAGATPACGEPITPAIADWALQNAAQITSRLRNQLAEYDEDGGQIKRLVNTSAPGWNIYHRDRQLLIAIPVKKNLLFSDKKKGEADAAKLVRSVMQQDSTIPLDADDETARLDEDAVRVVFIEPAVADIRSGAYTTGTSTPWAGFGTPVGYAPSGFYPQASFSGACGCH